MRKLALFGWPIGAPVMASTSSGARPSSSIRWMPISIAWVPMRLPTKFGVSLPSTMPLPSTSSPKALHARERLGRRVRPGHELEELHVADGVEEVHHEEALLEAVGPALDHVVRCAARDVLDATIVCGWTSFSSRANSACFTSSFSRIASIDEVGVLHELEVVLGVPDLDEPRGPLLEERGRARLERLVEPARAKRFLAARWRSSRRRSGSGGTISRSRTSSPAFAK